MKIGQIYVLFAVERYTRLKLHNTLPLRTMRGTCSNARIPCRGRSLSLPKEIFSLFDTVQVFRSIFQRLLQIEQFASMPRLSEVERGQAIAMLVQGQGQQQVAAHFGVHIRTIERLVQRLRVTGRVNDRPRSGRPRVTTPRQDRFMTLSHLRNRHLTASETANNTLGSHNRHIHPDTVRNRLRDNGLRARRPYVGLPLTPVRRQRRLAWLQAHSPRNFPMRQWRRVFFTDESRFTLYRSDGRRRVYRRRGERYTDACVVERDRFGGGSVCVWGGISYGFKSPLIVIDGNLNGVRYRDEILRPVAVPCVQARNLILQQDNARPHVARVCQQFLANSNIHPLDWPAFSPDLSPIEHLWDELDRRVRRRPNAPTNHVQLTHALHEEWNNIPMAMINTLVNSMHRRIRAATAAHGGHTRY